jgi:hypothetical protein
MWITFRFVNNFSSSLAAPGSVRTSLTTGGKNRIAFAQYPPMVAPVLSAAVNSIEAFPVEVEVNPGWGDRTMVIIGLPCYG